MSESCAKCAHFLEEPCQYLGKFCKYTVKTALKENKAITPEGQ